MKVLIIDNFDSFTYNLHHYVSEFVDTSVVVRLDELSSLEIDDFDKIILSPGPSLPKDYPIIFKFLEKYISSKSILGICLGHQAIAEFCGGSLLNLNKVKHGVTSENIIRKEDSLFQEIPNKFLVAHYHSWVVDKSSFPDSLSVTSENKEGLIMSFRHNKYDVKGVQFHPESILTNYGKKIIENWINS